MSTQTYLTSTVMGIINEMRRTQDYSACPYLADALQDADFPEELMFPLMVNKKEQQAFHINCTGAIVLRRLREITDPIAHYRHICIILGGEYLESLLWIDKFTEELGDSYGYETYLHEQNPNEPMEPTQKMDYRTLMEVAKHNFETGETMIQYGDEHWQYHFRAHKKEFWKHYEIVTGIEVEKRHDDWGLFGCSC